MCCVGGGMAVRGIGSLVWLERMEPSSSKVSASGLGKREGGGCEEGGGVGGRVV